MVLELNRFFVVKNISVHGGTLVCNLPLPRRSWVRILVHDPIIFFYKYPFQLLSKFYSCLSPPPSRGIVGKKQEYPFSVFLSLF